MKIKDIIISDNDYKFNIQNLSISDVNGVITSKDKEIYVKDNTNLIVQQDMNSQVLTFMLDREIDGVDLVTAAGEYFYPKLIGKRSIAPTETDPINPQIGDAYEDSTSQNKYWVYYKAQEQSTLSWVELNKEDALETPIKNYSKVLNLKMKIRNSNNVSFYSDDNGKDIALYGIDSSNYYEGYKYVLVAWLIRDRVTEVAGKTDFSLEISKVANNELGYIWQTVPATLIIKDGIPLKKDSLPTSPYYSIDGTVQTRSALDQIDNAVEGSVYRVLDTGTDYCYINRTWLPAMGYLDALDFTRSLAQKEEKNNKVTDLSSKSTDEQYPSAKLVYNQFSSINAAVNLLKSKEKERKLNMIMSGALGQTIVCEPVGVSSRPSFTFITPRQSLTNNITANYDEKTTFARMYGTLDVSSSFSQASSEWRSQIGIDGLEQDAENQEPLIYAAIRFPYGDKSYAYLTPGDSLSHVGQAFSSKDTQGCIDLVDGENEIIVAKYSLTPARYFDVDSSVSCTLTITSDILFNDIVLSSGDSQIPCPIFFTKCTVSSISSPITLTFSEGAENIGSITVSNGESFEMSTTFSVAGSSDTITISQS